MRRVESVLLILALGSAVEAPAALHELGQLLTTPRERQLIEARRHGVAADQVAILRFEGAALSNDGRLAVWLDGRRIDDPETLAGLGVVLLSRPGEPVQVGVMDRRGAIHPLRPGQALETATGRVLEIWETQPADAPADGAEAETETTEAEAAKEASPMKPAKDALSLMGERVRVREPNK